MKKIIALLSCITPMIYGAEEKLKQELASQIITNYKLHADNAVLTEKLQTQTDSFKKERNQSYVNYAGAFFAGSIFKFPRPLAISGILGLGLYIFKPTFISTIIQRLSLGDQATTIGNNFWKIGKNSVELAVKKTTSFADRLEARNKANDMNRQQKESSDQ